MKSDPVVSSEIAGSQVTQGKSANEQQTHSSREALLTHVERRAGQVAQATRSLRFCNPLRRGMEMVMQPAFVLSLAPRSAGVAFFSPRRVMSS